MEQHATKPFVVNLAVNATVTSNVLTALVLLVSCSTDMTTLEQHFTKISVWCPDVSLLQNQKFS